MLPPPITQAEIDARVSDHCDALLNLWWAEQGAAKPRDLDLIASVIPFARKQANRVLDLCCGPGDVGRAIRGIYPHAQIDFIDRDPFLTSLCKAANQRDGIPGRIIVRDLEENDWAGDLRRDYDVVATVNALHWFDEARAALLLKDVHAMLSAGGVFLLAEPTSAKEPFAAGFEAWKERQPPRYSRENWERFWSKANAVLGYDHVALLGSRADEHIGDTLSVAGWIQLLRAAGFGLTDVLLRDADQVIVAALKT